MSMRLAAGFVRQSPKVFVSCIGVIVAMCLTVMAKQGFWDGLAITLGLLTGVESPSAHVSELPGGIGVFGAWLATLAGWIIIPTTVAVLLGIGEKGIEKEEELEFELFKFATRLGLRGAKRREFVARMLERKGQWLPEK